MEISGYPPYAVPDASVMPPPPRLHWGWVLLLSALTQGLFSLIWLVVQANWVRKVTGRTEPRTWTIFHLCAFPLIPIARYAHTAFQANDDTSAAGYITYLIMLELVCVVGALAVWIKTISLMRDALESAPFNLALGGFMSYFFTSIYFQYFLRDWIPMAYSPTSPYSQYTYPNAPPQA